MLKTRAALAAAAILGATVLGAVSTSPQPAQAAADFTPWQLCLIQAEQGCYPLDANGNPRPPNLGDPAESDAFYQCVAERQLLCAGLPGDPNG